MSADLLRRAAAKIRDTARAADREAPAPWRADPPFSPGTRPADTYDVLDYDFGDVGDEVSITSPEAEHIALWSPDVAKLVADVLDETAEAIDFHGVADIDVTFGSELALARRILGEEA
ncbi:hypothetical protein [Cellulosimicrobium funkei]|uniref:hypothetical protein n=1 Tax=Cellulosimicrobium funkei TaxID=264251 RepID=UPI00343885E0